MIKITITSDAFEGEAYLVYSDADMLCEIDFKSCNMKPEQVKFIKQHAPVHYGERPDKCFGNAPLQFMVSGYEITFDEFWKRYNVKVNKDRCLRIWNRMKATERNNAYNGLAPYERHLQKNTWMNKANPETYLSNKYWQNEWKS